MGKESACSAGEVGSIPGLGRSPGGGNGNSSQHSCLENPMDRGALQVYVPQGCKESDVSEATEHPGTSLSLSLSISVFERGQKLSDQTQRKI